MQSVLYDTSFYVQALRMGGSDLSDLGRRQFGPVWLSSVVLSELYMGIGFQDLPEVEKLQQDFQRVGRILVPTLSDWELGGRLLARLAEKHDYEAVGLSRLMNDALIAMSAARTGITVVTANRRDFQRIAEFRRFKWVSH